MAGAQKRVMLEVDSVKFYPAEVKYSVSRAANGVGRRTGESMGARAFVWVDPHDVTNITQANQIELWKMATETKDPLHKVSITWYKDDVDQVLSNVEFQGWISVFQYSNPKMNGAGAAAAPSAIGSAGAAATVSEGFNNLLYLELVVVLDDQNFSKHKFTK